MIRRWMKRATALALIITLNACAVWTKIDTPSQEGPGGKYRVQAPVGWVRLTARNDAIVITRDGLAIQVIQVTQQSPEQAFRLSKGKLMPNALPADVAQLVIAELHAIKGLSGIVVKENGPATLAGMPAFRLRLQFRNARGVPFEQVVIGTARQNEVLTASYQALATHYFQRDLPTFEGLVGSLKAS
jgi:hypothetical protein